MTDLRGALDRFLADKNNRWGVIFLLSLAEIFLLAGVMLVSYLLLNTSKANQLASLLPARATPTPACEKTNLLIGSTSFPVSVIKGAPSETLELPAAQGNQAYQFTAVRPGSYLFGLNPSPAALSLRGSVENGSQIRIIWPDCSLADYIVQKITPGEPLVTDLSGDEDSISIFLPGENGLTLYGVPPSAVAIASATQTAANAQITPTCDQPALEISGTRYPVSDITPAADGSLTIPLAPEQAAYRISGTNAYALPPDAANLALGSTLHAGDLVTLIATGCATSAYQLGEPQPGATYDPAKPAPLLLFISGAAPGQGFAVAAEPVTAQEIITPTADPNVNPGIEAEISLLGVAVVSDSRINVRISIHNYGKSAFFFSGSDTQLLPIEAGPYSIQDADPALPFRVDPGMTQVFTLTFPRPATQGASVRIFTIEYPLEAY
jgi:hypothetical protein